MLPVHSTTDSARLPHTAAPGRRVRTAIGTALVALGLAWVQPVAAALAEDAVDAVAAGRGLVIAPKVGRDLVAEVALGSWSLVLRSSRPEGEAADLLDDTEDASSVRAAASREQLNTLALNYRDVLLDDTLALHASVHGAAKLLASESEPGTAARSYWQHAEVTAMLKTLPDHDLRIRVEHALDSPLGAVVVDNGRAIVVLPDELASSRIDVQDKVRLNRKVDATVGVRMDKLRAGGSQAAARATATWRVGRRSKLKASYGSSLPVPKPARFDAQGAPVATARHEAVEIEAEYRVDAVSRLRATAFRRSLVEAGGMASWPLRSVVGFGPMASKITTGAELVVDSLWDSGIYLRGALAGRQEAREGEGVLREWKARANLGTPLSFWGAAGSGEASYEAARNSLSGVRWPARLFLDLNLSMPMATGLDLSLRLLKLVEVQMGNQAAPAAAQDAARDPRGAQLQLSYRF